MSIRPRAVGRWVARAPNHLGDLVMALPALAAADAIVVVSGLAPLARIAAGADRIIPFHRGTRGFLAAARVLRGRRFNAGVVLPPSFSSAAMLRAGGVRPLRGLDTDGRGPLLGERVPRATIRDMHRAAAYVLLVTGEAPAEPPVPGLVLPDDLADRGRRLVGADGRRTVGMFPGSNAPSRRWDADRFRGVAAALLEQGDHVVVFGGPDEVALTAAVAAGRALDLGGRTDLPLLAAALAACDILLSNDSGPAHLAGAVGTPVVALFGAGNPRETRPLGPATRLLRRPDLPCVPCVKNVCPRSGRGFLLPEAERECLRLIDIPDVLEMVAARPRT